MSQHEIRNAVIGGYGGGGIGTIGGRSPNIEVFHGDRVAVTQVVFDYRGPGGTMYVCWGLKAGTGNFNNGQNLSPQGHFGSSAISVPPATQFQRIQSNTIRAVLDIVPGIPGGRAYDSYKWLATSPTADENEFLSGNNIDGDADVVIVKSAANEVSNLDVFYQLV